MDGNKHRKMHVDAPTKFAPSAREQNSAPVRSEKAETAVPCDA
jgi:hypothetical protein